MLLRQMEFQTVASGHEPIPWAHHLGPRKQSVLLPCHRLGRGSPNLRGALVSPPVATWLFATGTSRPFAKKPVSADLFRKIFLKQVL
jgi:hypothetical protein